MSDAASELAALVADTLALVDGWVATGAVLVPVGALDGLPVALPEPAPAAARAPAAREPRWDPPPRREPAWEPPPRRDPPPIPARTAPPRPVDPGPARSEAAPRPEAPRAEPRTVAPPSARPAPSPAPPAAASGSPGLAGLFGGRWQAALRDRGEEIAALVAGARPCPACGTPPARLRGAGDPNARLAVIAGGPAGERLEGEALAMLDRMLVHVLSIERADVWVLEAGTCRDRAPEACRALLLQQLEAVGPRVVLAMGPGAADLLGTALPLGEWGRWGNADVMATRHPVELLARPGDKRATMDHLTELRRRL